MAGVFDRESLAALLYVMRIAVSQRTPPAKAQEEIARECLDAVTRFFAAAAEKKPKPAKSKDDAKKASS